MLRVAFVASLIGAHGWGKVANFAEQSGGFPDPLGLGSEVSMGLAVFAEVVCGLALLLGIGGRLPAVVLAVFFAVAFFIVHGDDPFGQKEKAFLFLAGFAALAFTGPGRLSLGGLIRKRWSR